MGGTDLAKTVVTSALRSGKHVVTANKALIAAHLPELNALVETVNAGRQTKVHFSRSQYVTKPVALHNTGCRPVWSRGRSVDAQPYGCRLSLHCCGLSLHCCGFSLHGCGFSLIAPRPAPRSASLQHAPWVPQGASRLRGGGLRWYPDHPRAAARPLERHRDAGDAPCNPPGEDALCTVPCTVPCTVQCTVPCTIQLSLTASERPLASPDPLTSSDLPLTSADLHGRTALRHHQRLHQLHAQRHGERRQVLRTGAARRPPRRAYASSLQHPASKEDATIWHH